MIKKTRHLLWISVGISLLLIACAPEEGKFNSTEERQIRRLLRKQRDSIRVEQDSLCNIEIERRFDGMVDSLLKVRIEDLKTKMGKR